MLNLTCQTSSTHTPAKASVAHEHKAQGGLLVVAPHPDDEALIASFAILDARRAGRDVDVVILTNGDFDCQHSGISRQAESVAGLRMLGLRERDVTFLGYPDGYLARLGTEALPPVKRRERAECRSGNTTYGKYGAGHADYHRARHGSSAVYTRKALIEDLVEILRERRPAHVIVTHPEDTHPDHATAYALVLEATANSEMSPEIWSAIVHNGDCWPTGNEQREPCPPGSLHVREPMPPLSGSLRNYFPTLRLALSHGANNTGGVEQLKARAIAAHESQTRGDFKSYLFSFARRDELFFVETPNQYKISRQVPLPAGNPARISLREFADFSQIRQSDLDDVYEISGDAETRSLRLSRVGEHRNRNLQHWLLPHDFELSQRAGASNAEGVPLAIAVTQVQEHPPAFKVSLYAGGMFVGAAIDVFGRALSK